MNMRLSGHDRKKLAEAIKADINAYCVEAYGEGYRDHLGASVIGQSCLRRLVYSFRHMHAEQFDGRMLRLFNRGHKEEARFVEWLRGIGSQVWEVDENGKQFRFSAVDGHYGGSLDGVTILPLKYGLPFPFLLEMKTHSLNSFNKLVKNGMKHSKPEHWQQMCSYGEDRNFHYGIYIAINKNDDDLYVDVVELDHAAGIANRNKAGNVVGAKRLPPKVAASPAFDTCKYCPMAGVCHNSEPVDVNCRSCANASAIEGGAWYCNLWKANIPKDAIPAACPQWTVFG